MESTYITIHGRLPSRNQSDFASRSHWSKGAAHKREWQEFCEWQMRGVGPVEQPCMCKVTFYEKDCRRDPDNVVGGGLKPLLDAMQSKGIIKNDSHKLLKLHIMPVEVDKNNPRVEIELRSVDNEGN